MRTGCGTHDAHGLATAQVTEELTNLLSLANPATLLGLRDRCIFQVLYASAMRPDDLCRLKLAQADLSTQQLLIQRPTRTCGSTSTACRPGWGPGRPPMTSARSGTRNASRLRLSLRVLKHPVEISPRPSAPRL